MTGFKEYDKYDALGLADLVSKRKLNRQSFVKRLFQGLRNSTRH
jgi:hypothetical protein